MQIGHSLEIMPSEPGRPVYIDEVALDFPKLKFVASHTGWPWCEELVAMAWKHENVYIDISAHRPRYLDPSLVIFMNTRGRDNVLFGTNGLGLKDMKEENPKKYKKELAKWERMDKPVQAMQQKMGLQRMKPMLFTCIPYMIIFPIIAGFFRGTTGNAPVALPPMNPFDIPLLGGMMHASTELIPVSYGWIN